MSIMKRRHYFPMWGMNLTLWGVSITEKQHENIAMELRV